MTMTAPAPTKRLPKPGGLLIVFTIVLGLIALLGLGGRAVYNATFGAADYEGAGTGKVIVQIHPGDSARAIGATLESEGVVKSAKAFTKAAKADAAINATTNQANRGRGVPARLSKESPRRS